MNLIQEAKDRIDGLLKTACAAAAAKGELAQGELSVNDIADALGVRQPQASKHLRVLREVGLVSVREEGKQRFYRLHGAGLKPIHDWVQTYEHLWNERLDRLEAYLAELQSKEKGK